MTRSSLCLGAESKLCQINILAGTVKALLEQSMTDNARLTSETDNARLTSETATAAVPPERGIKVETETGKRGEVPITVNLLSARKRSTR